MSTVPVSGPNLEVGGWVAFLIIGGAVSTGLLAAYQLWHRVIGPLIRLGVKLDEALPILLKIARDFPNGTQPSLLDRFEGLDSKVEKIDERVKNQAARLDKLEGQPRRDAGAS
jgi:hypothetical protein